MQKRPNPNWHKTPLSTEAKAVLGSAEKKEMWGIIPINPPHIEKRHQTVRNELLRALSEMSVPEQRAFRAKGLIDFVLDKTGYTQYALYCKNCGSKMGTVWAKDATLKEWCDLHYLNTLTPGGWEGCQAVNVSPIDGQLGFECNCGEDTRDFRVNQGLPPIARKFMIEQSAHRRPFGLPESAYVALPTGSSQKLAKLGKIVKRAIRL